MDYGSFMPSMHSATGATHILASVHRFDDMKELIFSLEAQVRFGIHIHVNVI